MTNSVISARPTKELEAILDHLQKTEYIFANEKGTYIFKQAVAILNHVARNSQDKSEYSIDAGYLYEKIDKINDELSRRVVQN